jgi:hypothetical protein
MTTVAYPLGKLRPAASRGGDCAVTDLSSDLDIYDPGHRFVLPTHCRIGNGMLRLTVGPAGVAPSLTVEACRGRVVVGDEYEDTYSDTYGGSISTRQWLAMGTITLDSPAVAAVLTAVRIVRWDAEVVVIRLLAPAIGNATVTLRRGERQCRIQHGKTLTPRVATTRRIRWTASPSPAGTARTNRVEEVIPAIDGFPRMVGAIDVATADAGAFSLTTASANYARFVAGVGTYARGDRTMDMHRQAGDASPSLLAVT